jgi:hypothetical protein
MTIVPSVSCLPSTTRQRFRPAWYRRRSSEPNGLISSKSCQLQLSSCHFCGFRVYSGRFSAKRLTMVPSGPYSSIAEASL